MKKIISILLAFATILAICVTSSYSVFAQTSATDTLSEESQEERNNTESETIQDGENEDSESPIEPSGNKTWEEYEEVVEMYLCATASSLTGHVWLYFKNLTDTDVPVGYAVLHPGEEMSVGSLRNTRKNGGGTYYNGEAQMAKNKDEKIRKNTTSLHMTLNPEQLKKVNDKIKGMNFYNLLVWNCGNFATSVWNSVSKAKFVHICFPIFTILAMKICGAKQGALSMSVATSTEVCYKQTKNGIKEIDYQHLVGDSCIG